MSLLIFTQATRFALHEAFYKNLDFHFTTDRKNKLLFGYPIVFIMFVITSKSVEELQITTGFEPTPNFILIVIDHQAFIAMSFGEEWNTIWTPRNQLRFDRSQCRVRDFQETKNMYRVSLELSRHE